MTFCFAWLDFSPTLSFASLQLRLRLLLHVCLVGHGGNRFAQLLAGGVDLGLNLFGRALLGVLLDDSLFSGDDLLFSGVISFFLP